MANATAAGEIQTTVTSRQVFTAGLASLLAWSFDLFDLFILLYVASTIGPLFFPSEVETLSLAATYASFAVTLLMRPFGAALFGNYADRHGRKRAMTIAVFGVGIATALMGAVPTVAQIGLVAPVAFLTLRVVQGVFVGGVVASSHTIGTETVPEKWRGLMSGLTGGSAAGIGALLASLAFFVTSALFPGDAFSVWGWRVMFFTGLIGAILSFFIFRAVEESPLWSQQASQSSAQRVPLKILFSGNYLPTFLVCLIISAGAGAQYYLTAGYLPTFLDVVNGVSKNVASQVLIVSSLVVIIAAPLGGHVSQLIGRKKTFIIAEMAALILLPLFYLQLTRLGTDSIGWILLYAVLLAFFGKVAYAPLIIFLNERFPTAIRASGTGLNWNTGFAIGGIMPTFVTLASPSAEAIPSRLIIFVIGASLLFLVGALLNPETKGNLDSETQSKGKI